MIKAPSPDPSDPALDRLKWPLRLTWAGLWAEAVLRGFWPVWSLMFLVVALSAFGVHDLMGDGALLWGAAGVAVSALVLIYIALRRFRRPGVTEALERLDRTMPGRPISALRDSLAVGAADPASQAVWEAHRRRMATRLAGVRAPAPDLRLADRDPYALRYAALLALAVAVLFGAPQRVGELAGLSVPGRAEALAAGPAWEGWLRPPGYTGRPTIYLNDAQADTLRVPEGSIVTLRFYGDAGALNLSHGLSDQPEGAGDIEVLRSGRLAVEGPGGREWHVEVIPDLTPVIRMTGEAVREAGGQMRQPFSAEDDYGVVSGHAEVTLDLAAVDRRHGLAPDPEPREPLILDLPLPLTGNRREFSEALVENLSEHPWANLPVRIRMVATDARGQEGETAATAMVLPGQRFFDPLAAAVIELRRDLLWSRDNGRRSAQLLRAITHRPEGFIRNERAFLLLRVAMRRLDTELAAGFSVEARDEIAEALWEVATLIEAGDLDSARERLERAQDRLSEAMRNGADESEIAELMQEYRDALRDYMRQLAQEQQNDPDRQQAEAPEMSLSGQDLQDLLDELQRLMEEGRMAEAAELMEMLRQMMENMQVVQGEGNGEGDAMQGLADTLRDQQGLNDDTFRDLQERFGGEGQGGQGQDGLSERQQELRDRLAEQGEALPGEGTPEGDAARRLLDEAGRAMDEAEQALRDGRGGDALDRQSEAMDALREGMRQLGEAMAQGQQDQNGQQGQQAGRSDPESQQRDPLGREPGGSGQLGTDQNLLQGEDVYRRADELLQELRRRSGDQTRPDLELDYLRRLLDRF
ncbi:DUF4175 domain-containing protein [Halodurantibacterium flavum]|uniref:DUF4175 domain-containing protein n=1 Tax=Halodurantibacterium flavum TaxID=1382802 RepID=A0ABW4S9L7_9RHOB